MKSTGVKLKNKKILFLLPFIFVILTAVYYFVHQNPVEIIAEYFVPFTESYSHWNKTELIEKDEYGRRLYSFRSHGEYTNALSDYVIESSNNPVYAYILCQKQTLGYVYCYSDVCYVYADSLQNADPERMEQFKKENDWGQPLNDEKMTAIKEGQTAKMKQYRYGTEKEQAIAALKNTVGYDIEQYYYDVIFTPALQPFYVLRIVKQQPTAQTMSVFGSAYVFQPTNDFSAADWVQLNGAPSQWRDQINQFIKTNQVRTGDGQSETPSGRQIKKGKQK